VQSLLRPLLLQLAVGRRRERRPPSITIVVIQIRVTWGLTMQGQWVGLVAEVREVEGEGGSSRGRLQQTGLRVSQQCGGQEPLVCLSMPAVALVRKEQDLWVTVGHLTLLRVLQDWREVWALLAPTSSPAPSMHTQPLTLHLTVSENISCSLHTGRHILELLTSSLSAKLARPSSVSWLQVPRTSKVMTKTTKIATKTSTPSQNVTNTCVITKTPDLTQMVEF